VDVGFVELDILRIVVLEVVPLDVLIAVADETSKEILLCVEDAMMGL